jgi:hypothetical protein
MIEFRSCTLFPGIHVDYPNDEGQTPLFCACLGGNESVASYLLSSGANPNEYDIIIFNNFFSPVILICIGLFSKVFQIYSLFLNHRCHSCLK